MVYWCGTRITKQSPNQNRAHADAVGPTSYDMYSTYSTVLQASTGNDDGESGDAGWAIHQMGVSATARDPHPTAGVALAVGRLGRTCPRDSRYCREHPQPHARSSGAQLPYSITCGTDGRTGPTVQ